MHTATHARLAVAMAARTSVRGVGAGPDAVAELASWHVASLDTPRSIAKNDDDPGAYHGEREYRSRRIRDLSRTMKHGDERRQYAQSGQRELK